MHVRVLVALAAVAVAVPLAAQDDACSTDRPVASRSAQMEALFAPVSVPPVAIGITSADDTAGLEVLIARRDADGKIVFACVDSPVAAKRFLEGRGTPLSVVEPVDH
jgi:hypothetical protein